ncbi:uncharacterized protein LOC131671126 [Phymastichus coffea]|uniref:uncharacterized protein LOC131671126 n=1 Tax=Phymastichus coffea TaxID=108790 RepID=UPI00273AE38C|nr:uncharacterized protein LOC131671126 [Phymastichus coffea]
MSINHDNNIESLTVKDVLVVVQEFLKDDTVEVEDYGLKPYSEDKLGHMGSHLQLTITIKNSQTEIDFMNECGMFTEEFVFFQKVKPLLMENYKDKAWSPVCYLAKKEFLVMEDLKMNKFELSNNLLDNTCQIKSTLETLARFHACSIVAEARLTQLHKKPVFLNDYFPNNLKEKFFPNDTSTRQSTINVLIENTMNLVFAMADSFQRSSQNIRKLYKKLFEVVKPSKIHRNVICHGDLWANNLMFNDSDPEPQCVFVDFQTMRYAPNVLDVLQLLYLNTTLNYRKQHEKEFIRVYSLTLERTIQNNDETNTAVAPTFEENIEAYEDLRLFGASLASIYLPFILLDQKIINELYNGPDGFSNALYTDKTEITFAYMKRNESYKNRIEKVINELADIADQ